MLAVTITAVIVASGVMLTREPGLDPGLRAAAADARAQLLLVEARENRGRRDDYERTAFGAAWTDDVRVRGGGNGCDTRNDVLTRDLADTRLGPVSSCPRAVLAGEFRSPYTGEFVVFRRGRDVTAVQIDHIVPLAFAWDMGAWEWSAARRQDFANDPANLVAVDGPSNQKKGDAAPAEWMPPLRGFWCRYAVQFVRVVRAYRLAIDRASRDVLDRALRCR